MRFSCKLVDNYPPTYDVKFAPGPISLPKKVYRFVVYLIVAFVIGWLFPNQVNAILNKIPFFKPKD